jgi:hypothetical protein
MVQPEVEPDEMGVAALRRCPTRGQPGMTRPRKPYTPPAVLFDGDVRSVVLGGSPGVGDSGGSLTHQDSSGRPRDPSPLPLP